MEGCAAPGIEPDTQGQRETPRARAPKAASGRMSSRGWLQRPAGMGSRCPGWVLGSLSRDPMCPFLQVSCHPARTLEGSGKDSREKTALAASGSIPAPAQGWGGWGDEGWRDGGRLGGPSRGGKGRQVLLPPLGLAGSFGTNGTIPWTSLALLGHPPLQHGVMWVPVGIVVHPEVFLQLPSSTQPHQTPTPCPPITSKQCWESCRASGAMARGDAGNRPWHDTCPPGWGALWVLSPRCCCWGCSSWLPDMSDPAEGHRGEGAGA